MNCNSKPNYKFTFLIFLLLFETEYYIILREWRTEKLNFLKTIENKAENFVITRTHRYFTEKRYKVFADR